MCASDGQRIVAQEAANEEAVENPQSVYVNGDESDASDTCCNALQDNATLPLDNVVANEVCGDGSVKYGSALIQRVKLWT